MAVTITTGQPLFQREIFDGVTSQGPVTIAGTYTGSPTSITISIRRVADDTEVASGVDSAPSGNVYSITVADVPESVLANASTDLYYAHATAAGTGDTASSKGVYEFHVGRWIAVSGQSNGVRMFTTATSPPAAAAGTYYYETSFAEVPVANGVRELLNNLVSRFGVPWGCVQYCVSGSSIDAWDVGDTFYNELAARIAAVGDIECIQWVQGESAQVDSGAARNQMPRGWANSLNNTHTGLATAVGRTVAQCPLQVSGHAIDTLGEDWSWWRAQSCPWYAARKYDHIHYSHSMFDANMLDNVHWTPTYSGIHGRRCAFGWAKVFGLETESSFWEVTGCSITSETVTRVTLSTPAGSDFTSPSAAITGFEVSPDGVKWYPATGTKINATTIDLTHSALAADENRAVRFGYGHNPDRSSLPAELEHGAPPMPTVFWFHDGSGSNPIFQPLHYSAMLRSADTTSGDFLVAPAGLLYVFLLIGSSAEPDTTTFAGNAMTEIASSTGSAAANIIGRLYTRTLADISEGLVVFDFPSNLFNDGHANAFVVMRGTATVKEFKHLDVGSNTVSNLSVATDNTSPVFCVFDSSQTPTITLENGTALYTYGPTTARRQVAFSATADDTANTITQTTSVTSTRLRSGAVSFQAVATHPVQSNQGFFFAISVAGSVARSTARSVAG